MGNEGSEATSTSKIENNTLIVNETEMNFLNETVNESAVSITVDAASSCSQSTNVKQEISLKDIQIEGDLSLIGIKQSVEVEVNFSCVNKTEVHADIVNDMTSKIMGSLDATNNTDLQNQVAAKLTANAENGGLQIGAGGSTASTNSEVSNNTEIYNKTKVNLTNIVRNKVSQEFNANMYSECVNNVSSSQIIGLERIKVKGNVTLKDITQNAVISTFAECVNEQSFGASIINTLAQEAGLTVEVVSDTAVKNVVDVSADSSAKQKGILPDLGRAKIKGTLMKAAPFLAISFSSISSLLSLAMFM